MFAIANDFVPKAAAELPAYRKNYPPTTHEQTAESASRSQQKPADTTGYTKADGASHTGATNADDEREQSQAAVSRSKVIQLCPDPSSRQQYRKQVSPRQLRLQSDQQIIMIRMPIVECTAGMAWVSIHTA